MTVLSFRAHARAGTLETFEAGISHDQASLTAGESERGATAVFALGAAAVEARASTLGVDAADIDAAPRLSPSNTFTCVDTDGDGCAECSAGVDPAADGADADEDGRCDIGDTDDDGDGVEDAEDGDSQDATVCRDQDADGCDDCSAGTDAPDADGDDLDGDGLCDTGDDDIDGDGVANGDDNDERVAAVCLDVDRDSCDDCASGTFDPLTDGIDTNLDGECNVGDSDDDGDGVEDSLDPDTLLKTGCGDRDDDGCDDCSSNVFNTSQDGLDTDGDGACDRGDGDDDNDGVPDELDRRAADRFVCSDTDLDGCDDCSGGAKAAGDDGADTDEDGLCDRGDGDIDNDGVVNRDDPAPSDRERCGDDDDDDCDDCSSGVADPDDDGVDGDGDGLCDVGDSDDDDDGVADADDSDSDDPSACRDLDGDACDDCANGSGEAGDDGNDTDGDGRCDAGDPDDDGDGVADDADEEPFDPLRCRDSDRDGCNDCSNGRPDPSGDGTDTDGDGVCDSGDADTDGDGVDDETDDRPLDATSCADADGDGCDDCASGRAAPRQDGPDRDGDGVCDAGDTDDDGDGVADASDTAPLDPSRCRDSDRDACDDCSTTGGNVSGGDPADDGADADGDGRCDVGEVNSDGDSLPDPIDDDADNDGIPNGAEGDADADADGIPNRLDLDSDNDGLPDIYESGARDDDLDGRYDDFAESAGAGNNGLSDDLEAAPLLVRDDDGDGVANFVDLDSDADGLSDLLEVGLAARDEDHDGRIDDLTDENENGLADAVDPDPTLAIPGTPALAPDTDNDETSDWLDTDSDDDGITDAIEAQFGPADWASGVAKAGDGNADGIDDAMIGLGPLPDHDNDGQPDVVDSDDDGDGLDTLRELTEAGAYPELGGDPDGDGLPSYLDSDSDDDGVGDGGEAMASGDVDDDGVPDYLQSWVAELDSDDDGLLDYLERGPGGEVIDTDRDGSADHLDEDDDGDNIATRVEIGYQDSDVDRDGLPNHLDADADGDGVPDLEEVSGDIDRDGTPDYLDPPRLGVAGGSSCAMSRAGGTASGWAAALFGGVALGLWARRRERRRGDGERAQRGGAESR